MARPLAYITAVWSDEPHEAKEEALRFSRQVYDAGYSPMPYADVYGVIERQYSKGI